MRKRAIIWGLIFFSILGGAVTAAAENGSAEEEAQTIGRMPPRLSFLDGQVSFWRPGAQDWAQAQINTALAPGDQLYVQGSGNLELQVGAQAYVRGGRDAQIGLETQEPDFLRFKVTGGRVAFDLRTLAPGRTVEVDTPHGAFTMNHEGYFRLEVSDEQTTFTTRRAGRVSVATGGGDAVPMEPDESVVIGESAGQALAFQAAPPMDAWDTWNYDRTDALLEAGSSRYIAPDTYGAADLDRYGSWRVLPTYGRVWVPAGVAPGWAPYSTGSWMYDSYYGWTWVDTAPWGWAPYHHGRWVYANSYWCWAPGPIVHRAVYAPALVAFFGAPGVSVGISVGGPGVGWVALGWGEPMIPWWGRPGFVHRPWWGGWGGPHCINNKVIHRRTIVAVSDIHHYHNTRIHNALIVVDKDRFGHGHTQRRHLQEAHLRDWRPMHRAPNVRPTAASFAPSTRHGQRPPEKILRRSTVTFRPQRTQKPVVTKHAGNVRSWSTRSVQRKQPDWGHGRPRNGEPPKTFGPRSFRPSQPGPKQKSAAVGSQNDRRRAESEPGSAPVINRPSADHLKPRTSKPPADVRPPQRVDGSTGTGRVTIKENRSRSVERPSQFRRPSQRSEGRIAAPGPRAPDATPRVDAGRRVENKPDRSRPEIQRTQPRPQQPEVSSPGPKMPGRRGDGGFRASPRIAEPRQNHSGSRENWRPQMDRGSRGESGQRFQRRFQD